MYVGIDIGGTKTLILFGDAEGRVHKRLTFATHDRFDDWYTDTIALLRDVSEKIDGIGIGSIGPVDYRTGVIHNPPARSLWRELPIVDRLRADTGVAAISLDNDCNAAVLGEAAWGAARGAHVAVYYTVSTGVGTGVLVDGKLLHGRIDTEGGHQIVQPGGPHAPCGHHGCLEGTVSGAAIQRQTGVPAEKIDDPAFWDGVAETMANAMINTTVLLSPDVIVLGGGVTRRGDLLFGPLRRHTERLFAGYMPLPPLDRYLVPAGLGQESVALGALRLAHVTKGSPS